MAWIEKTGTQTWRVRFRRADGTTGSIPGFPTKKAATNYADDLETDQRRGTWLDPTGFQTTLADWVKRWFPTLDLDQRTLENYDSYLRCHILPRFGTTPMGTITTLDIKLWTKEAAENGYARATITGWVNLLSMILTDAVDQRLIPANPVHKRRRRGRRSRRITPEKIWATPEQVLRIADQAGMLGGPTARLLIITAAWTGCRWGELTGLHRRNIDLHHGLLIIDRERGALHESTRTRWIGPPKTAASARRIQLPPFLVDLLRTHLDTHPYEYVFTTPSGTWLWRSTFIRRVLRPAADGNLTTEGPPARTYPIKPGLTFHGLRHSHKTWLIADNIPEIAQARRLGHHLDNRIVETYSHVAPELEQRLLAHLEHRWHTAQHDHPAEPAPHPSHPDIHADATHLTPTPRGTTAPRRPRRDPHPALIKDDHRTNGSSGPLLGRDHADGTTTGPSSIPINMAPTHSNAHTRKDLTLTCPREMISSSHNSTVAVLYFSDTSPQQDITNANEKTLAFCHTGHETSRPARTLGHLGDGQ